MSKAPVCKLCQGREFIINPKTGVRHCDYCGLHQQGNHGLTGTTEYKTWQAMKQRCYNPNNSSYKDYGGRGITMCARWCHSFECFIKDMGPRPEGLTLERKDNDGNYEPSNCKWGTWKEQSRNNRHNRIIEFNGKKQCLADWAEEIGITRPTLQMRLKAGWSIKKALTTKTRITSRKEQNNGVTPRK